MDTVEIISEQAEEVAETREQIDDEFIATIRLSIALMADACVTYGKTWDWDKLRVKVESSKQQYLRQGELVSARYAAAAEQGVWCTELGLRIENGRLENRWVGLTVPRVGRRPRHASSWEQTHLHIRLQILGLDIEMEPKPMLETQALRPSDPIHRYEIVRVGDITVRPAAGLRGGRCSQDFAERVSQLPDSLRIPFTSVAYWKQYDPVSSLAWLNTAR